MRTYIAAAAGLAAMALPAAAQLAVPLHRVVVIGGNTAPNETISHAGMIGVTIPAGLIAQDLAAGTPPAPYGVPGSPVSGGQPGDTWNPPVLPFFTDDGQLTGISSTGNSNPGVAIDYGRPGTFHTVARSGASYGGGFTFGGLSFPAVSGNGHIAFDDNQTALVHSFAGGAPTHVLGVGSPAAGIRHAVLSDFDHPTVNGSGRMVYRAGLEVGVGGVTIEDANALYSTTPSGSATLIVRENDVLENGHHLGDIGTAPGVNNAGQIVFGCRFKEGAGDEGIVASDGSGTLGTVHVLAEALTHGPGMNPTEYWQGSMGIFTRPAINGAGQIAFSGQTRDNANGAQGSGIWIGTPAGALSLLVRNGQPAPGLGPGVTFAGVGGPLCMNAGGDILFYSVVQGPGVTDGNSGFIYAFTPDAGLIPLLRTGMSLETAPGVYGILNYYSFNQYGSGGQDGLAMNLNDRREFVVEVGFTNGLLGAYTGTIPAPATVPILALAGLLGASRSRRARGRGTHSHV